MQKVSNMKKLRWGILSTAKIARKQVIPGIQQSQTGEVVAIASRNADQSAEIAASHQIPTSYGSYEALLEDSNVDAIYIPLPNHMHVEWTMKCLEAGKHVLCEKPFALHSNDIDPLIALAKEKGCFVAEAFMVRTHPQWVAVKEMIGSGTIGDLRLVHGFFSYFNNDPDNIRNKKEFGGGALWDIGCYPVNLSRFVLGEEPLSVFARMDQDPQFHTDRSISAILDFEKVTCTFHASTQLIPYQKMQFFGTKGMIEVEIPFNAPDSDACLIHIHRGDKKVPAETIEIPIANQYATQADAFADAVAGGNHPTPLSDTYKNTRVIEALFRSSTTGQMEKP